MTSEEECEHEMFITIRLKKKNLTIPLSQVEVIDTNEQTREAVEDWHYWVNRGYEF